MTLTEFLLARIAEDEAMALEARSSCGDNSPEWYSIPSLVNEGKTFEDAAHIARHDPARVLAECEAKRLIIDMVREVKRASGSFDGGIMALSTVLAGDTLEALAWPYRDHPDYRPEWAATPDRAGLR